MTITKATTSALILQLALIGTAAAQDDRQSYGYVRTLEGSAVLISADTGAANAVQVNYPVLTGDRLVVEAGSRVELVLPDFNILRIDSDSEVVFDRLAFSADASARITTLRLERGVVQIEITDYALGDELPSLVLPNATIFLHETGSYRISTWDGLSRVTVRSGYAEASTERGSAIARADEEIEVNGMGWPAVAVLRAGSPGQLELWGQYLTAAAGLGGENPVDPALAYSASTLAADGAWLEVDGQSAWSPYVEESWRPYTRGTWASTPSGMSWIGYDSWGWVTGHYGSWNLHGRHGWLWYPGVAYAPAWVYWYWGPTYIGWVPTGFYQGHYGYGLTLGFLGFAGGYWDYYSNWTFSSSSYFGTRYGNDHYYGGFEMAGRTGRTAVPRGAIVTDTSVVARVGWKDGERVVEALAAQTRSGGRRDIDVTSFIARRSDLSEEVRTAVGSGRKWDGTARTSAVSQVGVRAGAQQSDTRRSYVASSARSSPSDRYSETTTLYGRSPADSRLSTMADQGWRSRGSSRRIYTIERPEAIEQRQAAPRTGDPSSRVRDAWRISQPDRNTGGSYLTYGSGTRSDPVRSYVPYGGSSSSVGSRSSSPVRRVIEGITSTVRPSSGSSRAGAAASRGGSQGGSSRGTVGNRSNTSQRSSSARSSAGRSSGSRSSSGRSSSSTRSSSGKSKSGGAASRSRSKSDG